MANSSIKLTLHIISFFSLALGLGIFGVIFLSFCGKLWWIAELATHFRAQYLWISLPLIILLLALKRERLASALAILASFNLFLTLPYLVSSQDSSYHDEPSVLAISININTHLGSPERTIEYVKSEAPDLLILQELNKSWKTSLSSFEKLFPHQLIHPREDNFGIALYSKFPIIYHKIDDLGNSTIPYITADLKIQENSLRVIAAHTLPPRNNRYSSIRNNQLEALARETANHYGPTLIIGDLNVSQFSPYFKMLVDRSNLIDPSLSFGVQKTWPIFFPILAIQIDHALHSKGIKTLELSTGETVGSDHLPLKIRFSIGSYTSGDESI